MNPAFELFVRAIRNPIKFKLFLLQKLPAALFVGLRVQYMDAEKTSIKVRYNWFTKNPFNSMYFAVEAMAAELSTGLLLFGQVYQRKPKVSMLVVKMEAAFFKKATGTILFTCNDGRSIQETIQASIVDGEAKTIICESIGHNEEGEIVARFNFTWSVKAKK